MKQPLLCALLLLSISPVLGQTTQRTEINGLISAKDNDVEGVVVFNASSNSGTVTNQKGAFTMAVGVNDVVEVFALQFERVSITITKEIIASKLLKIYLSEAINQLDTILLTSGLSGMLALDIEKAKERPKITMELGNMDAYQFFEERAFDNQVIADALSSITNKGGLYNGIDFIGLGKMLFRSKGRKTSDASRLKYEKPITLLDVYSLKAMSDMFHIPEERMEAFVVFVEDNGINADYFKKEHEILLIEFLLNQSVLFLNGEHVKN